MTASPRRWALLICGALAVDALLGTVQGGRAGVPVVTLSVVTALALAAGARAGMIAGFSVGTLLDLLADPSSLAGVHGLVGVALGAAAGAAAAHLERRVRGAALVGSLAVPAAAILLLSLHGTIPVAWTAATRMVPWMTLVGGIVTPLVLRLAHRPTRRPLTNTP